MWRLTVCLIVLLLAAIGCTGVSNLPPGSYNVNIQVQTPTENITIPNVTVTIPATTDNSTGITVTTGSPGPTTSAAPPETPQPTETPVVSTTPTTPPTEVTPMTPSAAPPPNFFDPSNIRLKFPPLTDADLQQAKAILAASTDNVTGGWAAGWGGGADSGRDGTVIFTKVHSEDQAVYKIWIKDYGKPTQQILGFGKLDVNGDIAPSSQ